MLRLFLSRIAALAAVLLAVCPLLIAQEASATPAEPSAELLQQAEAGDAAAQFRAGMAYFNLSQSSERRTHFPDDSEKALAWIQRSAEQGYADAQEQMGDFYFTGNVTEENPELAAEWYRKAADQNHPEAMNQLGIMHEMGRGLPLDDKQAVYWFNRSAELGHGPAQANLASMYLQGRGVKKDKLRAVMFYCLGYRSSEDIFYFARYHAIRISRRDAEKVLKMIEQWRKEHPQAVQMYVPTN